MNKLRLTNHISTSFFQSESTTKQMKGAFCHRHRILIFLGQFSDLINTVHFQPQAIATTLMEEIFAERNYANKLASNFRN